MALRLRDRWRGPFGLARLAGILVLVVPLHGCSSEGEAAPMRTAPVEREPIERIVVATGTIEPEGEIAVRPRIAGIVESVAVSAGEVVAQGTVLVEIERELLEARMREAVAAVETAEVSVRFAQIAVDRAVQLQERGASSSSALDEARSADQLARARRSSAIAARDTLAVELKHATVRAPVDGRILDVPIEEGAAVSPVTSVTGGTVLLIMAEGERLHLEGSVDENEVAHVEMGQPATIRTEAFPDREFEGRVREISPIGTRIQNITYFDVEVDITDSDASLLRPRMSGDAKIVAERVEGALVVPETALRYDGPTIFVEVVSDDGDGPPATARRDVEVGIVDGARVEITSGLEVDERVALQ